MKRIYISLLAAFAWIGVHGQDTTTDRTAHYRQTRQFHCRQEQFYNVRGHTTTINSSVGEPLSNRDKHTMQTMLS